MENIIIMTQIWFLVILTSISLVSVQQILEESDSGKILLDLYYKKDINSIFASICKLYLKNNVNLSSSLRVSTILHL